MDNNFVDKIKNHLRYADTSQRLIYVILACSLLLFVVQVIFSGVYSWVALSSDFSQSLPKFWTFFTYTFFHANIFHLLFNLIALYYFGQLFQTFFTQRQFLAVFVLGSVFSGIFFSLIFFVISGNGILLGASGGVMAILFATVRYQPHMMVRLPLIGSVKIWHIAAGFLLIDLLMMPFGNMGGRLAHLGGALFGLLYTTMLIKGTDMSEWLFWKKKKTVKKKPFRQRSSAFSERYSKADNQNKVNIILDKIRKSGYESLTKEEKEFLFKQK